MFVDITFNLGELFKIELSVSSYGFIGWLETDYLNW